jgi:predicted secreted hydrolase
MQPAPLPPGATATALTRRAWLGWQLRAAGLGAMGAGGVGLAAVPLSARALPARHLQFPRDHGAHPNLRTEWWYITGHAQAAGRLWGFQVTFFRSRVDATQGLRSAFAAKQLLFAHAAITDVQGRRLLHGQRIARAGFKVAEASEADTRVRLQDWSLERTDLDGANGTGWGEGMRSGNGGGVRTGDGEGASTGNAPAPRAHPPARAAARSRYTARVSDANFSLDLQFDTTQPVLLQGVQGLSRKGPQPEQASYYYSHPQMQVAGRFTVDGQRLAVTPGTGRAWMDHEASESLMHPETVGWDWIGMNLHDGTALTAFCLRRADGSALWAGGSVRGPGQPVRVFGADSVRFLPQRMWTSPRSGARYPVDWEVHTPAGTFAVRTLLDAQELDSDGSTGAIYWEGLCELHDSTGAAVGRGYLEMTGYARPLKLG